MKKICFVVSSPLTAQAFMLKHFEYLSQEFDITLVANFETEEQHHIPFVKETKDIKIVRNINLLSDLAALYQLYKYLKQQHFDAVHSITPKAGLIATSAAWLAGVKLRIHIFTGQVWHTQTGLKKKLLQFLDKVMVFFATDILVDGQSQRDFLIENHIIKAQNSKVLGKGSISGVDVSKFILNQTLKVELRKQLGYSDDEVVFVFLGRMNRDKGILDLVAAFKKLYQEFPQTKLLLIGMDEENLRPEIEQMQKEGIFFFGLTRKPQETLQAGDVFCLPSYREGFGTSVIEASLLQMPVICSDTYGLAETIVDNETGLRHKVADSEDLYKQMRTLFLDANLRKSMGEKGREYVLEYFSADEISRHWLAFYKEKLN